MSTKDTRVKGWEAVSPGNLIVSEDKKDVCCAFVLFFFCFVFCYFLCLFLLFLVLSRIPPRTRRKTNGNSIENQYYNCWLYVPYHERTSAYECLRKLGIMGSCPPGMCISFSAPPPRNISWHIYHHMTLISLKYDAQVVLLPLRLIGSTSLYWLVMLWETVSGQEQIIARIPNYPIFCHLTIANVR